MRVQIQLWIVSDDDNLLSDDVIACFDKGDDQLEEIGLLLEPAKTVLVVVPGPVQFECNKLILHPKTPMGSLTFSKSLQNDCVQFAAERGINVDEPFTHELDWNRRWKPNGCSIKRRSGRTSSSSFCGYAFDFAAVAAR